MNKTVLLTLLVFVFFTTCKKEADEQTSKVFTLAPFNTVELDNSFDVFLIEDSSFTTEVRGPMNMVKHIEVKSEGGILKIKSNKKLKWTNPKGNPIQLYIKSKPLHMVFANETCSIENLNPITSKEFGLILGSKANTANLRLNCNTFFYWNNHPCGGKVTLTGRTKELKLWNTAIMSIDATNLLTDFALVENSSQGVCAVRVLEKLEYKINGSGDIHVYGNPPEILQKESSSSGKLIVY